MATENSEDFSLVSFEFQVEGEEPIVRDISTPEARKEAKESPFDVKDGSLYKIVVKFRIQNITISGLMCTSDLSRHAIRVDKTRHMLGSFGPDSEPRTVSLPRNDWEEAPVGRMAHGSYLNRLTFVDDDRKEHGRFELTYNIVAKS